MANLTAKQKRFLNKWVDRQPALMKKFKPKIKMGDLFDEVEVGITGEFGESFNMQTLVEDHTLAAAATSATTISIPADSVVFGVTAYVRDAITGPTNWKFGRTIVGSPYDGYGNTLALTAGTSVIGMEGTTPQNNLTASTITFQAQDEATAFTAGIIRVVVNYMQLVAPTS